MVGWLGIVHRYVLLARLQDQPPNYAYHLPQRIMQRLSRKSGWLLRRYVLHLRRPTLLDEYRAAIADCRFLVQEMRGGPRRLIDAARWKMWKRRLPLDYVLGWTPFGGMRITVRPPVLIPRRETESWLGRLIEEIPHDVRLQILEAGSGSGCISVMLSKLRPASRITAVDISPRALGLGRENALTHGVDHLIDFKRADIFADQPISEHPFDLIVSNPPYVPPSRRPGTMAPSVRKWESSLATVGVGYSDGADFHRKLIEMGAALRPREGMPRVAIELDGTQQQLHVVVSHAGALGFTQTRVIGDQRGLPRALFLY